MQRIDMNDLRSALAGRWPDVLVALDVPREALRNRHGPCPGCGGTDRFRFDDKGRGRWICSAGGGTPVAGDGFALLMHVHGWSFAEALRAVADLVGVAYGADMPFAGAGSGATGADRLSGLSHPTPAGSHQPPPLPATPTARVRDLRRTSSEPESVEDVMRYLASRRLLPLPRGCALRAHAGAEYWIEGECVGRYPALLADVVDGDGDLVTMHVIYLRDGAKLDLEGQPARKLLSPMTGRKGCAVRLVPLGEDADSMGIAEGIETALAARALFGVPVWSALNTSMLAKWVPPPSVGHVVLYADQDIAGMKAAWDLREALYGRCEIELKLPPAPINDWADAVMVGP